MKQYNIKIMDELCDFIQKDEINILEVIRIVELFSSYKVILLGSNTSLTKSFLIYKLKRYELYPNEGNVTLDLGKGLPPDDVDFSNNK
jgi:hypothetical protein